MTYTLTTRSDSITVNLTTSTHTVTVQPQTQTITMSSTGGQGPQGVSVSNVAIVNNRLIVTLSDASTIDAGELLSPTGIKDLAYSAILDDILSGTLTTGTLQGGTY